MQTGPFLCPVLVGAMDRMDVHWSVLLLQSFEITSGIKTSGGTCPLFKSGDNQTGSATLWIAQRVILGAWLLYVSLCSVLPSHILISLAAFAITHHFPKQHSCLLPGMEKASAALSMSLTAIEITPPGPPVVLVRDVFLLIGNALHFSALLALK